MSFFLRAAPAALLLLATAGARADDGAPAFLAAISENDNYVPQRERQDRHYTNGNALAWGFPRGAHPAWLDRLGRLAPLAGGAAGAEYGLLLGQNLYTPEAFAAPEFAAGDRPFAGWLYAEASVRAHAPGVEESLAASLGVVGPAALGEPSQKLIHVVTGDREPRGWSGQLPNEPALLLRYRRSWFAPLTGAGGLAVDLVSRAGAAVGNVLVEAGAGAALRLGSFLPERDLPLRLQPGLSGNSARFDARPGRTDWFVFAGWQGRAVLRNMFLDGGAFRDGPSVDRKPLVWDGTAGVAFTFGALSRPAMLTFGLVRRGKEFEGQTGLDTFGSAQLAVQF